MPPKVSDSLTASPSLGTRTQKPPYDRECHGENDVEDELPEGILPKEESEQEAERVEDYAHRDLKEAEYDSDGEGEGYLLLQVAQGEPDEGDEAAEEEEEEHPCNHIEPVGLRHASYATTVMLVLRELPEPLNGTDDSHVTV